MKKVLLTLLLLVSPFSFAQEATGKIEEIQICGTGNEGAGDWIRMLQLKIDGKWFGIYADFYAHNTGDVDNEISTSMLYMAFSQNITVNIRATDAWEKKCGIPEGAMFHGNAGDYIRLSR